MTAKKQIQPDSISIRLYPGPGKFALHFMLVNRNDFPIAILFTNVPTQDGQLLDRVFGFDTNNPKFSHPVGQIVWAGDETVVIVPGCGEYSTFVYLSEFYSGLEGTKSVSVDSFMQIGEVKEQRKLSFDQLDLVRVKSNTLFFNEKGEGYSDNEQH